MGSRGWTPVRRHTVPRLRPWLPWTLLAITQTWKRALLEFLAQLQRGIWEKPERGPLLPHYQVICSPPHLVQRPHRHFAHIVGHMFPAGALWVTGGDSCSVPQVPWAEKQLWSLARSFWPILSCCGVNPQAPSNPSHPRALDPQPGAWASASPLSVWCGLHNHLFVLLGAEGLSLSAEEAAEDKECLKQIRREPDLDVKPWTPRLFSC